MKNASLIQEKTIPLILEGKDIFALAKTGSGKTAAFAIPTLQKIISSKSSSQNKHSHLILSPTRELAQQTFNILRSMSAGFDLSIVNVIGGESAEEQIKLLRTFPDIVVGTPGRINDLSKQKELNISLVQSIIFDEADRLFDMGFKKEIEYILKQAPNDRQIIMLSATSNQDVIRTAYKFHSHPEEIKTGEDNLTVDKITQKLIMLTEEEKFPYVVNLLRREEDIYAIIFCNTQFKTHLVGQWLKDMGLKADSISGRLPQNKRTKLMESFRNKETTILVCTDVAARGLDIKNVDIVVNYDLPSECANYVHRIGRTGRAGQSGEAYGLCAHEDCENLEAINKLLGYSIPKHPISNEDFSTDICPKPKIDRKTLKTLEKKPLKQKEKIQKSKEVKNTKPIRKEKSNMENTFTITTSNLTDAKSQALNYFKIHNEELLQHEITKKGKKKFFFFGPRECTYEFKFASLSSTEIENFINKLLSKMHLNLYIDSKVTGKNISIDLKGEDIGLVLTNRKALLLAIDHVVKQFIFKKSNLPKGSKVFINAIGENAKKSPEKNFRSTDKRENRDNRGNRDSRGNRENRGNRPQQRTSTGRFSDEDLIQMANGLKLEVLKNGKEALTQSLNAAQRRIIHTHLQEDPQVETTSIGDGRFKKIKISMIQ